MQNMYNCDNCCCSTRLQAPTKELEREKRHNAVCDIAALNKFSKQSSISQDQPTAIIKEGKSSVSFGHIKNMDCHIEDTKNEGGK